jgi:hypothetical protein
MSGNVQLNIPGLVLAQPNLLSSAGNAIRMAGKNLGAYLTSPKTAGRLGQQVATETALGTAVSQGVPRLMGQTPAVGPLQTAANIGLHSAIAAPVSGGLAAMGMPGAASLTLGQITGTVGSQALLRAMAPQQAIDPETNDAPHVPGQGLHQLQQFHAEQEQQRYNNEINLALAKNYHNPVTTVVHRNPSAELETVRSLLNPNVRY